MLRARFSNVQTFTPSYLNHLKCAYCAIPSHPIPFHSIAKISAPVRVSSHSSHSARM